MGGMEKHVDRTMYVPNADRTMSHNNTDLVGSEATLIRDVDARIEQLKKEHNPRITKASVRAIEYMMTASPEAFRNRKEDGKLLMTKQGGERWRNFVNRSKAFLEAKHGKENLVKFTVHLDEKTPHIHAFVVPITKDNRLSAKDFLGGKQKLRELQDQFAKVMEPLGLKRGEKGSKVEHESIQQYYHRVNQAQDISLAQEQLAPGDMTKVQIPKPPTMGKESWRSEQEQLINEKLERLQKSLSNERSQLNKAKARLNEERSTRAKLERSIEKMKARIWHLENPEQSKKIQAEKQLEKQVIKGRDKSNTRGI